MIESGDLVTMHYAFWVEPGKPLESTFEAEPEKVRFGTGEFPAEIERVLRNVGVGETREFSFPAGEGVFGLHESSKVKSMPREAFAGVSCEPGALVEFETPGGERVSGRIERIDADHVIVDFNNPLAGRDVHCRFQVVEIEKAKEGRQL